MKNTDNRGSRARPAPKRTAQWMPVWLQTIRCDIAEAASARRLYEEVTSLAGGERIARALLESAFLGARRQLDTDNKTISLRRLLERLRESEGDLALLIAAGQPVLRYVDRAIAHRDKRGAGAPPMPELNRFLDLLIALVNRYNARLGAGLEDLPPLADDSWKRTQEA